MNNQDFLQIAISIKNIAMLSDDENLKRIKPHLNRIEEIVLKWNKEFEISSNNEEILYSNEQIFKELINTQEIVRNIDVGVYDLKVHTGFFERQRKNKIGSSVFKRKRG